MKTTQPGSYEEIKESPSLTTEQAIFKVGGFGWYQLVAGAILIFSFSLTGQIIYNLSFLQDTKNVTILCRSPDGVTSECDQDQACDSTQTASYSFDTLHGPTNFITEAPELVCYSSGS